ncbi:MAG: hypothetical protein OXM59_07625 [Gammaproteobacteria bacterium]|nr:hypothetical protein [Gammaproteobacteria bacterium]
MRIESLDVYRFPVPFRVVFRHASASRSEAANVIVAARGPEGSTGYGEGCPREYVTGETQASAAAFIRRHSESIARRVRGRNGLAAWMQVHRDEIDANPAAFCALEIAVLDLMGRTEERSIEDLIGVSRLSGKFRYSAVLGDSSGSVFSAQADEYLKLGFRDFKVKVSGDGERDAGRVRTLMRRSGSTARIRLDANNFWNEPGEAIRYLKGLGASVFAIEEPLQPGDFAGMRRISRECGVSVILDESLARIEQIRGLEEPAGWIVNLRVSKMGGIQRSLALASEAVRRGLGLVVGAQVGETSILTRAALTVMNEHSGALVAAEGAFGTRLLEQDLAEPCLMFGGGGTLNAETNLDLARSGLGLRIHEALLTPI